MCSVILWRDVTRETPNAQAAMTSLTQRYPTLTALTARRHRQDTSLGVSLLIVCLLKWRYSWKHRSSGSCGGVLISAQHKQSGRWNREALSFSPLLAVCSFNCRQRFSFFLFPLCLFIYLTVSIFLSHAVFPESTLQLVSVQEVSAVPSGLQRQGDIYQFNALACYKYTCQPSLQSTLRCSHSFSHIHRTAYESEGKKQLSLEGGCVCAQVLCLQFMLSHPERS